MTPPRYIATTLMESTRVPSTQMVPVSKGNQNPSPKTNRQALKRRMRRFTKVFKVIGEVRRGLGQDTLLHPLGKSC